MHLTAENLHMTVALISLFTLDNSTDWTLCSVFGKMTMSQGRNIIKNNLMPDQVLLPARVISLSVMVFIPPSLPPWERQRGHS